MERVPDRQPGEGEGPFRRLVIRGAMLIDGSGAPPRGPVDIVIAGNRIESIRGAGTPGLPVAANRAPADADREIDATGMYVLPGFIDMHGHNGDPEKAPNATYGYRLWLAHGVTTVRGVALYDGPDNMSLSDRARSRDNTHRRAAAVRLCGARRRLERRRRCARPSRRGPGCAGRGAKAMRASNSSTPNRPRSPRAAIDEARRLRPRHDRASWPKRRRRTQRRRRRRDGARHGHPFLRPFRSPAAGPPAARLSQQLQYERRAMALRPSGAARRPDRRAGRAGMDGLICSGSSSAESPSIRPSTSIRPGAT